MDLSVLNEIKDPAERDKKLAELVEAEMVKKISVEVEAKAKQEEVKKPAKKSAAKK